MRLHPIVLVFVFITAACLCTLRADDLTDFKKQQAQDMNNLQKDNKAGVKAQKDELDQYMVFSQKQFAQWQAQQQKEFNDFRNSINKDWGTFVEPSNKKWVEYGKDKKTVASVDFEKGTVTVEAIRQKGESVEDANKRIVQAVARIAESKGSRTAAPVETSDPTKNILQQPILQNQLVTQNNQPVTPDNAAAFVQASQTQEKIVPITNGAAPDKVVLTFALAPDNIKQRMQPFLPFVQTYSAQRGVDPDHVLATIHTESYFNPAARSGCGALGLMQLMPDRGGAEAYQILKGKGLIPSAAYLYDAEKNIELGCIYIGMLETKYFGTIKNKNSKTFCAIAGYNTGPGNVAFTFTGKRNVDNAIVIINNMTDDAVYSTMIQKLPYPETRGYLKTVSERMKLYQ